MEGALWCHIITLLCAAGDWISGWAEDREDGEDREEDGGSSSISSAKILSRRDIRAPKVESFSLAAAAAAAAAAAEWRRPLSFLLFAFLAHSLGPSKITLLPG